MVMYTHSHTVPCIVHATYVLNIQYETGPAKTGHVDTTTPIT